AGEGINVSYEQPQTVLEIVERVLLLLGRADLRPDIRNEASGEIRDQYLNASRARKLLGWTPRVALDAGLARTIEWYRSFLAEAPCPSRWPSPASAFGRCGASPTSAG